MELSTISTVELPRRVKYDLTNNSDVIRCTTFHPTDPHLLMATDDDVYLCNALRGTIMNRYSIVSGQVVALFAAQSEPLFAATVSLNDEFQLYVWNTHLNTLRSIHPIKYISPKKSYIWVATKDAKLIYMIPGTKQIYTIDWKDGSIKKIESPKPVQHLSIHPQKPLLGTILSDGVIRVINLTTNNATTWNDTPEAGSKDKSSLMPIKLVFHTTQPFMISVMSNGSMTCWNTAEVDPSLGNIEVSGREPIEYCFFHPTLPFLLTATATGALTTWSFFPIKNNWIVKIVDTFGRTETNPIQYEMLRRYSHLPSYLKITSELLVVSEIRVHNTFNLFMFNFKSVGKVASDYFHLQHIFDTIRMGIFSFSLLDASLYYLIVPQQNHLTYWASPDSKKDQTNLRTSRHTLMPSNPSGSNSSNIINTPRVAHRSSTNVFYFPNEAYFLDDSNLVAYSPAYNDCSLAKKLPVVDFDNYLLRPTKIVRSWTTDRFLVFFLRQNSSTEDTSFGLAIVCRDTATKDITVSPAAGQRGIFLGGVGYSMGPTRQSAQSTNSIRANNSISEDYFLVLSESGLSAEIWKNEESTTLPMVYDLPSPMADVFWTPWEDGLIVLFLDLQNCRLIASHRPPGIAPNSAQNNSRTTSTKFTLNSKCTLKLYPDEIVTQVLWQHSSTDKSNIENGSVISAIVTSKRLMIVDSQLNIICQTQQVATSCLWLGPALLFTTRMHLHYLTLAGTCNPLVTLQLPDAALLTSLGDRVVLAVRRSGETVAESIGVGLLEPLVIAHLHYFDSEIDLLERKDRLLMLKNLSESYDARRISWKLIEQVSQAKYDEFALQLLLANPNMLETSQQLAFHLAIQTHYFTTAFELIEKLPSLRTEENLRYLAEASLKLGQFDITRRCAEAINDWATLIYLYILTNNRDGMVLLSKQLGELKNEVASTILPVVEHHLAQNVLVSGQSQPSEAIFDPKLLSTHMEKTKARARPVSVTISANNNMPPNTIPTHIPPTASSILRYTPYPVMKNTPFESKYAQRSWHIEGMAVFPSEMRTLPLDSGSGNLVIGPLLPSKLFPDWFPRQIPYFQLPEALRGDTAQREVILKLLSNSGGKNSSSNSQYPSNSDIAERHSRRTLTVGGPDSQSTSGTGAAVPSIDITPSTSHSPATSIPSLPLSMLALDKRGLNTNRTGPTNPAPITGDKSPRKSVSGVARGTNTVAASTLMAMIANSTSNSAQQISTARNPIHTPSESTLGSQGSVAQSMTTSLSDTIEESPNSDSSNSVRQSNIGHSADVSTTQIMALAEQALISDSYTLVSNALAKLEQANYDACILDLNALLLSVLASHGQQSDIGMETLANSQIRFASMYKAFAILVFQTQKLSNSALKNSSDDRNAIEAAHFCQFLAFIKVLPLHRVVALRMAVNKNLQVKNYGFAAKCLELLISKDLPDKDALKVLYDECNAKKLIDTHPLPPKSHICFKSLSIISPTSGFILCKLCNATYRIDSISLVSPCIYCFWKGNLTQMRAPVTPSPTSTPSGHKVALSIPVAPPPPSLLQSPGLPPHGLTVFNSLTN